jgi:hypothetical protein
MPQVSPPDTTIINKKKNPTLVKKKERLLENVRGSKETIKELSMRKYKRDGEHDNT